MQFLFSLPLLAYLLSRGSFHPPLLLSHTPANQCPRHGHWKELPSTPPTTRTNHTTPTNTPRNTHSHQHVLRQLPHLNPKSTGTYMELHSFCRTLPEPRDEEETAPGDQDGDQLEAKAPEKNPHIRSITPTRSILGVLAVLPSPSQSLPSANFRSPLTPKSLPSRRDSSHYAQAASIMPSYLPGRDCKRCVQ